MKYDQYIVALLTVFFVHSTCMAYDSDNVHPLINEKALSSSNVDYFLKNRLNLKNGVAEVFSNRMVKEWLKEGGREEDTPFIRSYNHFHDPTKEWNSAGLKSSAWGESSIFWAQESVQKFTDNDGNEYALDTWSWPKAEDYFYQALTSTDQKTKEEYFAQTFNSLGHVMHLLADAGAPEHTRNDIHIFPLLDNATNSFPQIGKWTYETWCRHNSSGLATASTSVGISITNNFSVAGLSPVGNFWDTTPTAGYNANPAGLAEFTNFNFVSGDTIFTDYSYPEKVNSFYLEAVTDEDGKQNERIYFNGLTSDNLTVNHFVSSGYLWSDLVDVSPDGFDDSRFSLDDKCFSDYASILVPKAVGYSAGLLDYFFRGTIEISVPTNGVYSSIDSTKNGFSSIKLLARNSTSNGDAMTDGDIRLVVKYRLSQSDPFQPGPVQTSNDFSYIVSDVSGTRSLSGTSSTELEFDLSNNPIPLWATDVYLQVVYHGRLGSEDGAVAVGFKDISEPRGGP